MIQPYRGCFSQSRVCVGDSALNARWSPAYYEGCDDCTSHLKRPHASLRESVDTGATKRHSVAIVTGIYKQQQQQTH